jgi:hypothetical protein
MTRRDHDERHGFRIGLRHAAESVLRARALLHGKDADTVAAGDTAQRIGHVHTGAFLTHQDRPDASLGRRFDHTVARIADEIGDALTAHDLGDGSTDFHVSLS